jgi:uncharacterized protein YaaN involved in tellurite resistance
MALKNATAEHPKTVGHVSREASVAVHKRVKEILARREVALQQARRAAQHLKRS